MHHKVYYSKAIKRSKTNLSLIRVTTHGLNKKKYAFKSIALICVTQKTSAFIFDKRQKHFLQFVKLISIANSNLLQLETVISALGTWLLEAKWKVE